MIREIVTAVALFLWFGVAFATLMAIASMKEQTSAAMIIALVVVLYPFYIGILYLAMGWTLFGIPSWILLLITIAMPTFGILNTFGAQEFYVIVRAVAKGLDMNGITIQGDRVYFEGVAIEGANSSSFHPVDKVYFKDGQHVYFRTRVLAGVDPATFAPLTVKGLPDPIYQDSHHVILGDRVLAADPGTFESTGPFFFRDRSKVFWTEGEVEGADSASFQELGRNYAKDKNRVYAVVSEEKGPEHLYVSKLIFISDADPATFVALAANDETSKIDAKDAHQSYYLGKKVLAR